ncbi:MAG: hypothetical protein PHH77_06615 [Victivallaceae bacterium]|nr:hypothetical protein [Victivallaceae bacterium]
MKLDYIIAPRGWKYTDRVFTEIKRPYTCIYFLNRDDDAIMNGTGKNGIFTFAVSKCAADIKFRVADYLRYENRHGRLVIAGADYDFDITSFIAEADKFTPPEKEWRLSDPAVAVHSTNPDSLKSILKDRAIKSSRLLADEEKSFITLGYGKLHEPPEYNQYVHYGPMASGHTEAIVLSQQKGEICTDLDSVYVPGARIYLDHHKMIDAGIVTRDGLHIGKVKGFIDLDQYLLDIITAADIDKNRASWTPSEFFEMANMIFEKRNLLK